MKQTASNGTSLFQRLFWIPEPYNCIFINSPVLGVISFHRLKVEFTMAAWLELMTEPAERAGRDGISACWVVLFCMSWRMGTVTICSSPVGDDGIGLLSCIYRKQKGKVKERMKGRFKPLLTFKRVYFKITTTLFFVCRERQKPKRYDKNKYMNQQNKSRVVSPDCWTSIANSNELLTS